MPIYPFAAVANRSNSPRLIFICFMLFSALFASPLAAAESGSASIEDIDNITILPLILPEHQTPEDREENLSALYGELDDYTYKALFRKLALKGYVLNKPRRWTVPADWNVEHLRQLAPDELAALAPKSARNVAFLFLERVESTNQVVASSAAAAVTAMIINRKNGTVVWQKSTVGKYSEHLLQIFKPFGMLLTPDKHAAVEEAFTTLFEDFPEKPYR
jgi:hypothetical protein